MPELRADVAVIGAGAAGLMCAIVAGKRGRKVLVVEHNNEIGRKILISGGGRCNFTHLDTKAENFVSANPHFAKSALARYRPHDFVRLVEKHGVPYHEKTPGQLFCDRSARDITALFESECRAASVCIQTGCGVRDVRRGAGFELETTYGLCVAESLVVATGGLSIPKIGASSFGYDLARQFGLKVLPCRPALVPLTFGAEEQRDFGDLAGVALEVDARSGSTAFREKMLFTHRGLSGPAILQLSTYWQPGSEIHVDLLPGRDLIQLLAERRGAADRSEIHTIISGELPKRLAVRWCELNRLSKIAAGLSDREIRSISDGLHDWRFVPSGTEGYSKAEVTAGGVDTAEISSKNLECKKVPGLYFIGEVLDVTGQLGGFNFQWAWASGHAAGEVV